MINRGYLSRHEIVDDVLLYRLTEEAKIAFRKIDREDVSQLVDSIGQYIIDDYELWDAENPYTLLNYKPQIIGEHDVNPKHPYNLCYRILLDVWERMQ